MWKPGEIPDSVTWPKLRPFQWRSPCSPDFQDNPREVERPQSYVLDESKGIAATWAGISAIGATTLTLRKTALSSPETLAETLEMVFSRRRALELQLRQSSWVEWCCNSVHGKIQTTAAAEAKTGRVLVNGPPNAREAKTDSPTVLS